MEPPRRSALAHHVHRSATMGAWVLINARWSFNGGPVKDDYERYCPIYDWVTVVSLSIAIVCVFCFGCASNTVCRVQGRLRGRDVPAAG